MLHSAFFFRSLASFEYADLHSWMFIFNRDKLHLLVIVIFFYQFTIWFQFFQHHPTPFINCKIFTKLNSVSIIFPNLINRVIETFQYYFLFNNLDLFSTISKLLKQFHFCSEPFCWLLVNSCKCFQSSLKLLNNFQN